ncbi:hypothetical protein [Nitrobacter sp.]|uniref:hypothetical protein n=1 Tax=Nitrobacter sp. TaxID=29420 RepID=UPI003F64A3C6
MRSSDVTLVTVAPAVLSPITLPHKYAARPTARPGRDISWPFDPNDVTPLQWWRTMPADRLNDAQYLLLRATLEKVSLIKRREWLSGMRGDAAASIAIALHCLPITAVALEVGLAMSAVALHALGGDAASAMLLSHILRRVPLDHPFARDLALSWLALNLRRAMQIRTKETAQASLAPEGGRSPDHGDAFFMGGRA